MKNKEAKAVKSKLRINVIDILIIVLALACIAAMVLRATVLKDIGKSSATEEYIVTFKASSLSSSQYEAILNLSKEDSDTASRWVYTDNGKTRFGELLKLGEQNTEKLFFTDTNGNVISLEYPQNDPDATWTVTGTIACNGTYTDDGGFLLNGKKFVASNTELDVYTSDCDFSITIINIQKADKR